MRVIRISDVDVEMSVRTVSDAYVVSLARMWMFVASSIFVVVFVSVVAVVRLVPVRVFECVCERERVGGRKTYG